MYIDKNWATKYLLDIIEQNLNDDIDITIKHNAMSTEYFKGFLYFISKREDEIILDMYKRYIDEDCIGPPQNKTQYTSLSIIAYIENLIFINEIKRVMGLGDY